MVTCGAIWTDFEKVWGDATCQRNGLRGVTLITEQWTGGEP